MIKVQLLVRCDACKGQAYLSDCMDVSNNGEPYQRYKPCLSCQGSGNQTKWVSLTEFAVQLEEAKCKHPHISYQGNFRFTEDEPWDDLVEVCDDCGVTLG
jgi:hypothetical protein